MPDEEQFRGKLLSVLQSLQKKHIDDNYVLVRLGRLIPLLKEHSFWSSQPVIKFYEKYREFQFNTFIEKKTVEEVKLEPYGLPRGFEWSSVDL